MKTSIIAFLSSGITMLGLDSIWLTLSADPLYRANLGDLLLPKFEMAPAAIFYPVYVAGVVVLAVKPALAEGRVAIATLRGATLGLVAYATYDLTNQATLKGWSPTVTVADLCWGTFLTACAATVGYLVTSRVR